MDIKRLLQLTGTGYAVILMFIMAMFLIQSFSNRTQIDNLVKKDQVLLLSLSDMYAQGLQTGQALRNVLINQEDETAVTNLEKANEDYQKAFMQAVAVADGKPAENLSILKTLWEEDKSLKHEVMELSRSGRKNEALDLLNNKETRKWREAKALILEMLDSQKSLVTGKVDANRRSMRINAIGMGVVITLALAGSLLALLIMHKRVILPLGNLVSKIGNVAEGDLRVDFDHQREDEVGMLSKSMSQMVHNLKGTIHSIMLSVHALTSSAANLENKSESAAVGARNQSDQSYQIATAAEEMSQTIMDMAKNAVSMANMSQATMQTAQDGKGMADSAVESVVRVNDSTEELSNMISLLNQKVGQIDSVVMVISEIADQTNLLALNAAIEAARAGEQGRGFAVVADEVRKLAERTIEATNEIMNTINSVQGDSRRTMESMQKASANVNSATDQIKQLGDILSKMVQSVEQVQNQTTQIATAIEEQSATSDEIAGNISTTSKIAQTIVGLSSEVMDEAKSISSIAKNLAESGHCFKMDG